MSDLIDRQAAIDAVRSYYDEQYALCDSIEELIEKLPSAQPAPKRGRWINYGQYADFFPHSEYRCSVCDTPYLEIEMYYNYCPNCGAKMEEDA